MKHFEVLEAKKLKLTTFYKLKPGEYFAFSSDEIKESSDIMYEDIYLLMSNNEDEGVYFNLANKEINKLLHLFDWKVIKLKIDTLIVKSA